jgi:hypothetical protein
MVNNPHMIEAEHIEVGKDDNVNLPDYRDKHCFLQNFR